MALMSGTAFVAQGQSIRDNKKLGHFFATSPTASVATEGNGDIINIFKLFDMDRNGFLDSGEYHFFLTSSFQTLMGHEKRMSWNKVLKLVHRDGKKDDEIDADKRSRLRLMFALIDRNHDEHVDHIEIEKTSLMIFDQLDSDNDRKLDNAEFAEGPGRLIMPTRMTREEAEPYFSGM